MQVSSASISNHENVVDHEVSREASQTSIDITFSLQIALTNAQSLSGHIDEFRNFFSDKNYHVIAVTESWLKDHMYDASVSLDNYYLLRRDRSFSGGGGVCVYVHNSLRARCVASSRDVEKRPEFLMIEISAGDAPNLLLCVVYRPPRIRHFDDIVEAFTDISYSYSDIIIVGDFNINMQANNRFTQLIHDFTESQGLSLVPSNPTHHTAKSHTWLDLVIVDNLGKMISFTQSGTPFLSGHELISLEYKFPTKPISNFTFTYRDFRSFNSVSYLDALQESLGDISFTGDISGIITSINIRLIQTLDRHAPQKSYCSKRPPAPWIDTEMKNHIAKRERLRNRLRRNPSPFNWRLFSRQRNLVQLLMSQKRTRYNLTRLSNSSSPKEHWQKLQRLGLIKTKSDSKPLPFSVNDLNRYFSSIISDGNPPRPCNTLLHTTPDVRLSRFYFHHVTLDIFLKTFFCSRTNSSGIDCLSWKILEISLPVILPYLLDIFNGSLDSGIFPAEWKKSTIKPIPKKKNPSELKDFRPISLLPVLSKILEKIVQDQITQYLTQENLTDELQSGYKKGHSTQTVLLKVVDDIKKGMDEHQVTVLVLFDFSKAFDMVDHFLLLTKMRNLNFSNPVLTWIYSYLTNRKQAVKDEHGNLSDWSDVIRGVPQGSGLGPSFFTILLNNISDCIRHLKRILYADDLQAFISCFVKELQRFLYLVEADIHSVHDWANNNLLKLNIEKTKIIIFGTGKMLKTINFQTLHQINIDNVPIPFVPSARNLGVFFSADLNWLEQVKGISKTIFISLRRFKSSGRALSFEVRLQLITAIVQPYIDYCCLLLLDNSDHCDSFLLRALNASIRFIFRLRKNAHISMFYNILGWLSIRKRRLYFLGIMIYNILQSKTPSYLTNKFQSPPVTHNYNLRNIPILQVPFARLVLFQKSFSCMGARFWNYLPPSITSANSVHIFKRKLKNHLLTNNTPFD